MSGEVQLSSHQYSLGEEREYDFRRVQVSCTSSTQLCHEDRLAKLATLDVVKGKVR